MRLPATAADRRNAGMPRQHPHARIRGHASRVATSLAVNAHVDVIVCSLTTRVATMAVIVRGLRASKVPDRLLGHRHASEVRETAEAARLRTRDPGTKAAHSEALRPGLRGLRRDRPLDARDSASHAVLVYLGRCRARRVTTR
jgi:hypothetical protein